MILDIHTPGEFWVRLDLLKRSFLELGAPSLLYFRAFGSNGMAWCPTVGLHFPDSWVMDEDLPDTWDPKLTADSFQLYLEVCGEKTTTKFVLMYPLDTLRERYLEAMSSLDEEAAQIWNENRRN